MARPESPPESPLSSMASSDAFDDDMHIDGEETPLRPPKRQRVDAGSTTSSAVVQDADHEAVPAADPLEGMSDVSSDTSGDIPSSPINARLDEEDFQDQVTTCDWDGCLAGVLPNMDRLVEHIHNTHIENRQKKYTCEWNTCPRKGMPHASGYALKAHMRSHTREKPFYCYLPECDRSFTRSDALAKHMRTVHETEALRPSDPIPKSMQSGTSKQKLKIILKTPSSPAVQDDGQDEPGEVPPEYFTPLPPWSPENQDGFQEVELDLPIQTLHRNLHLTHHWANETNEVLTKEIKVWEDIYHKEWLEKEVLLSQVIQGEVDWHERREAVLSGTADVHFSGPTEDTNGTTSVSQEGSADKVVSVDKVLSADNAAPEAEGSGSMDTTTAMEATAA